MSTTITLQLDKLPASEVRSKSAAPSTFNPAVVRLRTFSDVVSMALAMGLAAGLLLDVVGWEPTSHLSGVIGTGVAMLLLSLLMSAITRYSRVLVKHVILLGSVYQILGAYLISNLIYTGTTPLEADMLHLSWLAVWILVIPLFVPAPPIQNLVTSILSALSAPVLFLISVHQSGAAVPPGAALVHAFLPYFLCAGLANAIGFIAHDWATSVAAAERQLATIGSYRLLSKIGSGGMGEVWLAEHALLTRPAAIKLVHQAALSKSDESRAAAIARFEQEAKATASLSSVHTVRLFDYGVAANGALYYVMEYLHGVDLHRLLTLTGPLSAERAVFFALQICDSIAEAHAVGLVHRDLKPSNVLVCHAGLRFDVVKVLDFGLVARAGEAQGGELGAEEGAVVGTPAFMAPEQVEFLTEIDPRVDVYAVGCLLYWLVAGDYVFASQTAAQAIAGHLYEQPALPPEVAGSIPEALEALILSCLEKDPSLRPADGRELAAQLSSVPLLAPWDQTRAREWWAGNPELLREGDPAECGSACEGGSE